MNNIFTSKKLNKNQLAVILYTSGTESDPKGVGLTHENLFSNRIQVLRSLKIDRNEKFFTCLPFFHLFGCLLRLKARFIAGGPVDAVVSTVLVGPAVANVPQWRTSAVADVRR